MQVPTSWGHWGAYPAILQKAGQARTAQAWVWAVPSVGVSSVTLGTPLHGSGPLLPHCGLGVDT